MADEYPHSQVLGPVWGVLAGVPLILTRVPIMFIGFSTLTSIPVLGTIFLPLLCNSTS